MCGIVTIVALRGALPNSADVERMRDSLAHRGPDDATIELVDGWVALGHRRLSIIDVAGARQPLRSEDGNVVCIFNGEIYNFLSLRQRLEALGHRFATNGDGEVIVHGYEEWGEDVFPKLEGMFAAVVVDRRARTTLLARDRFGIKPLFYAATKDGVAAASEIKALLTQQRFAASATALSLGAMRMHVPWPLTAFHGVSRLPPGAFLKLSLDSPPVLRRYASIVEHDDRPSKLTDADEALRVLRAAVARQMVADVPVGAFLSGGIDSTLLVNLMREVSSETIHTFSIRTVGDDESSVAADTALRLQTTHHTVMLEDITFDDLVELPRLFDEPFAETSALGIRALSRAARVHVKVALSGDGGDEVFGGYASYRWIRAAGVFDALPTGAARALAYDLLTYPWPSAIRRVLRSVLLTNDDAAVAQRDVSLLTWAASSAGRALSESLSAAIEARCSGYTHGDRARCAMTADRLERLPNAMLAKVDIASMSSSLEVRVPMLDDEVVRYADRVPIQQLLSLRSGKVLLRRVMEKFPTKHLAWAAKRGFSIPLDQWMHRPLIRERLNELFGDQSILVQELTGFDVYGLWTSFLDRDSRFSQGTAAMQLLWFANVALWAERFAIREAVQDPLALGEVV